MVLLHFGRAFTFRDFKLDLGSMSLMDEVFTGDEWSKYLPVQKCPSQEEDTDHLQTSNVQTCNDNELSMTANPEHHGLRPESHSGSGHSCEDTDLQRTVMDEEQDDSGVESSTYIYAIQTEDGGGANTAEKKTNPSGCHEDSEGVYDYVEYMIPMPSHWHNSKSTPFLDFSVVKVRNTEGIFAMLHNTSPLTESGSMVIRVYITVCIVTEYVLCPNLYLRTY